MKNINSMTDSVCHFMVTLQANPMGVRVRGLPAACSPPKDARGPRRGLWGLLLTAGAAPQNHPCHQARELELAATGVEVGQVLQSGSQHDGKAHAGLLSQFGREAAPPNRFQRASLNRAMTRCSTSADTRRTAALPAGLATRLTPGFRPSAPAQPPPRGRVVRHPPAGPGRSN